MAEVTICPHLLVNYNMANPADIEEYIIEPLREILQKAYSLEVKVVVSEHIVDAMTNSFPWDKLTVPAWKGYVLGWSDVIRKYIEKKATIIHHEPLSTNNGLVCDCINQHINDVFVHFLSIFAKDVFAQNLHSEGIISTDACGNNIAYKNTHPVKYADDLFHVKYPWLRTYDSRLPYSGEHVFIPPANWKKSPIPIRGTGPKHGYKDIRGYEWEWDTLHRTHWDVQMGGGLRNYMNITPDGRKI